MRNQAGEKGETEEARAETGTGKAAVRRNREEKERKNSRLSSWKRKVNGRKKGNWKRKRPEVRTKVSTCGTAVGANQGRAKGNIQEAEYEEPGKKTRETRSERTGKTKDAKAEGVALEKPL